MLYRLLLIAFFCCLLAPPAWSQDFTITTVAGDGTLDYVVEDEGAQATSASLYRPHGVDVDSVGNLYIADYSHHSIRKVDPVGVITTVIDGLSTPSDVAVHEDGLGNLTIYIAEYGNNRISKVDGGGSLSVVAAASRPRGVDVDEAGNVFFAEYSTHKVRKIDTFGNVTTVAGTGVYGYNPAHDGGPAIAASLSRPFGVTVDGDSFFIADTYSNRIRKVDAAGIITTVVGNGDYGYNPAHDGGQATAASLSRPYGVTVDGAGNLYVVDTYSNRVRKVDAAGIITGFAGDGVATFAGDGGLATAASLYRPARMVAAADDIFYIADYQNHRVRKVFPRPTNSQPSTSGLGEVAVIEDAADTVVDLTASFDDVEDGAAALTYSVQGNSTPSLVSTSVTAGSLTLGYAAEASGVSDITVRATDSEGLFVESTFTVTVNAVNDTPTTSGLADVLVDEDAPDTGIELTNFFGDVEDGAAGLTYSVAGNNDPSLVTATVSGSGLTLAYAANVSGSADVTVRGADSGGLSVDSTFTVTVNAVNDNPTTTGLGDVTVDEDAADTVMDLTGSFDDVEDGAAGLVYSVSSNSDPFLVTATVSGSGLTLAYAANASGTADVTVRGTDSGGLSVEDTFTVTVNPVNDPPTTGGLGNVTVDEDAPDTVIDLALSFDDVEDGASGLVYTVEANSNPPLVTTTVSGAELTLAYATEAAGTVDLTVRATDGADVFVESAFTVTVNVVNDAPQFDTAAVTTAKDGEAYLYNIVTSDAEGNALTITAPTKPGWLSLVDNGDGSAVLSGTPAAADVGANSVELQVTDDGVPAASSSQAFTVTVSAADNNAPTSAGIVDVTVDEDAPDTLIDLASSFDDLEDGAAGLIYSVSGNSNGSLVTASVSGSTLTLDYAADAFGVATITVRGTDSGGLFIEESVTVTVNGVNDPPSAVGLGDIIVDEDAADTLIDLATAFADLEDGPGGLLYNVSANSNAALVDSVVSGSGLTLSYATNASGVAVITVRGTDSGGLYVEDTFTVTVNAVNDTPKFESVAVTEAYEGEGYVYLVVTSDPEGGGLVVSAPTKPSWLTLSDNGDGTAILSGIPGAGDLGDHPVELQVTDVEPPNGTASQSFTITVVPPVNSPPTTTGLADVTVDEDAADTSIDLTSAFADLEDGAASLTYAVTNNSNPLLVSTSVVGSTLTLGYAPESSGSAEITVRATDSEGLSVEDAFVVTVNAVNDAPTTTGISDVTVDENAPDTTIDLLAFFDDAEEGAAALTFMIEGNSNASLVTPTISGGELILSYTAEAFGVAEVTVRASDSAGQFVSDTFAVTVNKVNNVPVITEGADTTVNIDEDGSPTPFSLTLNATDADGDLLLWSISGAATHGTANADGVGASKAISYTPEADYVGNDSFIVQVTDGYGGFAHHTVTVNMAAQNDAPTITGQDVLITSENTPLTITLAALTVSDPDNLPADFTLAVLDGAGYTRIGNDITPDAAFVGFLPVAVKIGDGQADSAAFDLSVSVTPAYGLPETASQVQAGASFSGQVKSDGTLWAWGSNGSKQLGYDTLTDLDPSSSNSSTLRQQVGTDSDWAHVALGSYHAVAIKTDGTLWAWGRNVRGQLGDGTNDAKAVPTQIGSDTDWVAVTAGIEHTVALKSNGTLWAWGYNNDGQLGNGDLINQNAPVQVDATGFNPANPWTAVAAGGKFTLGIKLDGSLWGWGDNFFGQLGSAADGDYSTEPVRLGATDKVWQAVAAGLYHSVCIDSAGNLWAWGSNDYGQLGDGTTETRYVPVQVTSGVVWSAIEAGNYFSAGVQNAGSLWTWGANDYGQLGDGNGGLGFFTNAPAQVGTDTDWVDVAAGAAHTLALKVDGTVYAWGSNQNGQLGDASFNDTVAGSVSVDTVTTLTNSGFQTIGGSVDGAATSVTLKLEYVDGSGNPVSVDVPVSHTPGLLTWTADLTLTAEGENIVTVTATDGGLYTATAQERIVYDLTAPEPPAFDDMVGVTLTNDPTPTWLWNPGGGDGDGSYRYNLNNAAWSAETFATSFTPATDLDDGMNTLYVQERDAAGNWSDSGEYALVVDTLAPSAPSVSSLIDGVPGETETRNLQPTWTWTSGDGSGTFIYNFDGGGWSLPTTETAYTPPAPLPVADGQAVTYTLQVQERDAAGNWSDSGSFAVTVDREPPYLADIDDVTTNASTQQLTGMTDFDATLSVSVDTGATATELMFNLGNWVYELSGLVPGANLVTVTATDYAGNPTVKTATITLNTAPTTSGLADVAAAEDDPATTLDLTTSFDDAEDGAAGLIYSVEINSNASLVSTSVTGGSLTLSYADNAFGSADITVRATDSGGMTVDSTFAVTVASVNDQPTTTGLGGVTVDEDAGNGTIDLAAFYDDVEDGAAALTYTVTDNSNVSLVSTSVAGGTLTLDYLANTFGAGNITVRATDGGELYVESVFSVTVNAVNDQPIISGVPAVSVDEDSPYSFVPTSGDEDLVHGDALTFSIVNQPAWAAFDEANGTLSGIPINDNVGTTGGVVITVTDGFGASASLPAFDLEVVNVNDAPAISGTPFTRTVQGQAYSFVPVANDIDPGEVLTFSIVNQPGWADFDTNTGTLSGTPANEHVGITSGIVITVTDSGGVSASLPAFDLTVATVNNPPTISGIPYTKAVMGQHYSFVPTATEVDAGDALTFSIENQPSWTLFSPLTGELRGTPTNIDLGVTTGIMISVVDAAGETASLPAFDLTVAETNSAPAISGTPPVAVDQDNPYNFTPVAEDADGDILTYSINAAPVWATFDEETGVLSGTPGNADVGVSGGIVITVTDSAGESASLAAFDLEVRNINDAPTIGGTPATTAVQGAAYSFAPTFGDEDLNHGDVLTFSINAKPSWATFNTATGVLSGTPLNGDVGNTTTGIVISVTDTAGVTASLPSFNLAVANTNDPPTISGTPAPSVNEDSSYSFVPTADDVDLVLGDALNFSIANKPAWAAFNEETGEVSGTPGNAAVGTTSGIVVTVTDSVGASASLTAFDLEVVNVNDAPTIDGAPQTSVDQDSHYSFEPTFGDDDLVHGDILTFSIVNQPLWAGFDEATGTLSGTPAIEHVGTSSGIVISVSDVDGESASLPAFDLTVIATNSPPVIIGEPVTSVLEDTLYSYTFAASDADGDALTPSAPVHPAWLIFDTATGVLSGTPGNDDVGDHSVTLRVSDGTVEVDQPFTISVSNVNDAPSITSTAVTDATEDTLYSYTFAASDADGDALTPSAPVHPAWLIFDTATGVLSGTPGNDDVGDHSVTLRVSDGTVEVDQPFTIAVTAVNDKPTISGTPVTVVKGGQTYSFVPSAADPEGDALTFSIVNKPSWANFDSATGELSGTPTNDDVGVTDGIVIGVSDGELSASLSPFSLAVLYVNHAPTVANELPDQVAWVGTAFNYPIPANTFADEDAGDILTLSASLKDGSALPIWLDLDSAEKAFWGTPSSDDFGTITVKITATDGTAEATDIFTMRVAQISDVQGVAMEWGTIEVEMGATPKVKVPLAKGYERPVVVARAVSASGKFGFVQVKNVTSSAFEVVYNEPAGSSGDSAQVFYLVAEAGEQDLGGLTVQAGMLDSSMLLRGWESVAFGKAFSAPPAVFASVQTVNDAKSVITRTQNLSTRGFEIGMQELAVDTDGHDTETVGWIAIEKGIAETADGRSVLVFGATASDVSTRIDFADQYSTYFAESAVSEKFASRYQTLTQLLGQKAFTESFSGQDPMMIGNLTSAYENDAAVLQHRNLEQTGVELFVQEDGTGDAQHALEDFSVFVAQ